MATHPLRVFISYIHEERVLAEAVKCLLDVAFGDAVVVFLADNMESLPAGADFQILLQKALRGSKVLISLLSPVSVARPWINLEAGAALITGATLIPIVHSGQTRADLKIPWSTKNIIDLSDRDAESRLISAIQPLLGVRNNRVRASIKEGTLFNASRSIDGARHFFGIDLLRPAGGAAAQQPECSIYLQPYDVDKIFDGKQRHEYGVTKIVSTQRNCSVENISTLIKRHPPGRMYKARRWVNSHDAGGARWLSRQIHFLTQQHPEIHTDEEVRLNKTLTGLAIYMGLGFTDGSKSLLESVMGGWGQVDYLDRYGDCLLMSQELFDSGRRWDVFDVNLKLDEKEPEPGSGLFPLVPLHWSIEQFVDSRNRNSLDYGIILRHTRHAASKERSKVEFVCAGFTEHGTFHAGKYLAENWESLRDEAREGDKDRLGCGDFLAIICGYSHRNESWKPAWFLTPLRLLKSFRKSTSVARNIKPDWVRRWHELSNKNV